MGREVMTRVRAMGVRRTYRVFCRRGSTLACAIELAHQDGRYTFRDWGLGCGPPP